MDMQFRVTTFDGDWFYVNADSIFGVFEKMEIEHPNVFFSNIKSIFWVQDIGS